MSALAEYRLTDGRGHHGPHGNRFGVRWDWEPGAVSDEDAVFQASEGVGVAARVVTGTAGIREFAVYWYGTPRFRRAPDLDETDPSWRVLTRGDVDELVFEITDPRAAMAFLSVVSDVRGS